MELGRARLLIATVSLFDPNFRRSVVLLCEHRPVEGAYGLVLNHAMEIPTEARGALPFAEGRLYRGGPVRPDALQVLHPYGPNVVPGAVRVLDDVFIGGDFDVLKERIDGGEVDPSRCRFFLGYSGWGEGQLEGECEDGSWLVGTATPSVVWEWDCERLWSLAVRQCGEEVPLYRHFPGDVGMN